MGVHSAGVPRRPSRSLQQRVERDEALRHRRRPAHPDGRRQRRRHRSRREGLSVLRHGPRRRLLLRARRHRSRRAAAAVAASTAATLPGVGQTWSPPMPTAVNINGATQNADKLALVIGGGYEADQDSATCTTDTIGNSIYIVDSVSGALLWHGSRDGSAQETSTSPGARWTTRSRRASASSTSTATASPTACTPATWAARSGASTSRNGQSAGDLVAGGVIAQLGGAPVGDPGRRRHSALLQRAGRRVHQHARRQLHPRRHRLGPPRPPAEH